MTYFIYNEFGKKYSVLDAKGNWQGSVTPVESNTGLYYFHVLNGADIVTDSKGEVLYQAEFRKGKNGFSINEDLKGKNFKEIRKNYRLKQMGQFNHVIL